MATIDDLMAMFAEASPEALICRGPEHPTHPEVSLAERVRLWLAAHPFLDQDAEYVQFLRRYAGALIADREGKFGAVVHGFHPEVGYLDEYDFCRFDPTVSAVDERGLFQFALMSAAIVVRYSGQQKFATSRCPPPPPPPDDRPNPMPFAPVSAMLVPFWTSLPTVGFAPRGSLAAIFGGGFFRGGALVGSTISGAFADGGRTGSIAFFGSIGTACWIVRPPSVARPPSLGPIGPPRLMFMIVSGGLFSAPNQAAGTNTNARINTRCAAADAQTSELSASSLSARAMRTSLTASMTTAAPSALAQRCRPVRHRPPRGGRRHPLDPAVAR